MTTRSLWMHELSVQRGILVKTIDATLKRARGVIIESSLAHVQSMLNESLRLFLDGETLASMWAGQAAWEAAASMNYAVGDFPLHHTRWKVVAGGKKGAERRKVERGDAPVRDKVTTAIKAYKGNQRAMASNIAKRVGCSARYVRDIKAELALP